MILEVANIEIKDGQQAAFEERLAEAQAVLTQAEGYLRHQFQQCIETPNKYILLIRWTSLEAHEVGFRKSALFKEWRALIGDFFAATPQVAHYELKMEGKEI